MGATGTRSEKVVVAMSGGVDSSLAAVLLQKAGYDVVGVTLKLVEGSRCCDLEAVSHAREVCEKYGIPHHVIDVSREFNEIVVGYYIDELRACRTPNPCVICNRFLKFDQLMRIAKKFGAKRVATGHYARIRHGVDGDFELLKGRDLEKDQSYYLSFLKQSWLKQILFPVGRHPKTEIYKMAKEEGLGFLVSKKQSQDLCFVDDKLRQSFVGARLASRAGDIVDRGGRILGKHKGVHNYTIGQRKGLGIGGAGGAYFVITLDAKKNQVVVSQDVREKELYSRVVKLRRVNFVSGKPSFGTGGISVMAKIRYQQKLSRAVLKTGAGAGAVLEFKKPQRAVTRGQIAVFYQGSKCLGGGIIK